MIKLLYSFKKYDIIYIFRNKRYRGEKMKNLIDAIINLVTNPKVELVRHYASVNRANSMGDALEEYVKDLFAGTVEEADENIRNEKFSEVFSYLGNSTNPPDSMLKNGGDAIEVKKLQGINDLALNSSHPKRVLRVDNPKINVHCRNCEPWTERDMLYVVGICDNTKIKTLMMVYGTEYCADIEIYSRIENVIKDGLKSLEDVELANTNELGRLNRVDPLGITNMRIRGMWTISNPLKVFDYVYSVNEHKDFNFMCLISFEKYATFENTNKLEELLSSVDGLIVEDVKIKNPNNPAQLKNCKLIRFEV